MATYRVQAILSHNSGLPEDAVTNTFHFQSAEAFDLTDLQELATDVVNFYVQPNGGGDRVGASIANHMVGVKAKLYDLGDPEPRVPIVETLESGFGARGSATDLPSEVALCLSFRGEPLAGADPKSRRGRIYLGPFCSSIATGTPARPQVGSRNVFIERFQAMCASAFSKSFVFVVHGKDGNVEVTNGYIDNAFDTVRSRGEAATSRIAFTV